MVEIARRSPRSKDMLILSVLLKSVILLFSLGAFIVTVV